MRAVGSGRRHSTLVRLLLRQVRHCDTAADLEDVAATIAADHFEIDPRDPFSPAEIAGIAAWVWKVENEGRNWVGQEAKIMLTASEFVTLQESPDALTLHLLLLWSHGWRPDAFALSCKAMAQSESITGWTDPRRYARARAFLVKHKLLELTHKGGRRPRDPSLYRMASTVLHLASTSPPTKAPESPVARGGGLQFYWGHSVPEGESLSRHGRLPLWQRVGAWFDTREHGARQEIMAAFDVGAGEAQRALKRLCEEGRVERLARGLYRASGSGKRATA